ncbi:MAG: hypothetical protein ER33_01055 [Cyanobium sp. CACIAM 14]|nr:MAG: hypothetical protein ER33_01055 [Cyanobium sp. CACIAM 14]
MRRQLKEIPALWRPFSQNRWNRYLLTMAVANAFIWMTSILFLLVTKPVYTSKWALILPSNSTAVDVNLPEIGKATSSSGSGIGGTTYDTRANYEYIFTSDQVLREAARLAGIEPHRYGKPRIKLIDNTTLMQFEVSGRSPKEAQQKSIALYRAAQQRLNQLREGEIRQREGPSQRILLAAQKKLERAQQKVTDYKFRSGLSSPDQVKDLSSSIEQLRRQHAEIIASREQASQQLAQLTSSLGLTPAQASSAFQLQVDQIFQQYLKDYSESTATLKLLEAKYGNNHPRVLKERNKRQSSYRYLIDRSRTLLGQSLTSQAINKLALSDSSKTGGRDILFQNLLNFQVQEKGLHAQASALEFQIANLEQRLKRVAKPQSNLESLKRDEQIAEAVFASTLTKLDLGQGDLFAAFPLVQLAVEPSLPDSPAAPKKKFILAGATAGSLFTSLGLWLLWLRKPWMKRVSRWVSS